MEFRTEAVGLEEWVWDLAKPSYWDPRQRRIRWSCGISARRNIWSILLWIYPYDDVRKRPVGEISLCLYYDDSEMDRECFDSVDDTTIQLAYWQILVWMMRYGTDPLV
jgi:hypothetical protein